MFTYINTGAVTLTHSNLNRLWCRLFIRCTYTHTPLLGKLSYMDHYVMGCYYQSVNAINTMSSDDDTTYPYYVVNAFSTGGLLL